MADQVRFRGTWAPQIRDPVPWSPKVRRASVVLDRLVEDDVESSVAEDDAVVDQTRVETERDELANAARRVERAKLALGVNELDDVAVHLIKRKAMQTALYGLIVGASDVVPGFSTLASFFVGSSVDASLSTKLQMDLTLELAYLYGKGREMSLSRASSLSLVCGLTRRERIEVSAEELELDVVATNEAGTIVWKATGDEFKKRSVLRLIPMVGAVRASCTNLVATYVVGRRSISCFRDGPDCVPTWIDSLKKHTTSSEVDLLVSWNVEAVEGKRVRALRNGAKAVGNAYARLARMVSSK